MKVKLPQKTKIHTQESEGGEREKKGRAEYKLMCVEMLWSYGGTLDQTHSLQKEIYVCENKK